MINPPGTAGTERRKVNQRRKVYSVQTEHLRLSSAMIVVGQDVRNNPHDTCEELCRDPKHCPSRECERQEECAQHEYFKATRLACFCQSLGCFASSRDRKGPEPSVIPR